MGTFNKDTSQTTSLTQAPIFGFHINTVGTPREGTPMAGNQSISHAPNCVTSQMPLVPSLTPRGTRQQPDPPSTVEPPSSLEFRTLNYKGVTGVTLDHNAKFQPMEVSRSSFSRTDSALRSKSGSKSRPTIDDPSSSADDRAQQRSTVSTTAGSASRRGSSVKETANNISLQLSAQKTKNKNNISAVTNVSKLKNHRGETPSTHLPGGKDNESSLNQSSFFHHPDSSGMKSNIKVGGPSRFTRNRSNSNDPLTTVERKIQSLNVSTNSVSSRNNNNCTFNNDNSLSIRKHDLRGLVKDLDQKNFQRPHDELESEESPIAQQRQCASPGKYSERIDNILESHHHRQCDEVKNSSSKESVETETSCSLRFSEHQFNHDHFSNDAKSSKESCDDHPTCREGRELRSDSFYQPMGMVKSGSSFLHNSGSNKSLLLMQQNRIFSICHEMK